MNALLELKGDIESSQVCALFVGILLKFLSGEH